MRKNKKIFFIVSIIVLAVLFFGVVLVHAVFYAPVEQTSLPVVSKILINQNIAEIPVSTPVVLAPTPADPKQLRIPSIKVNAKIQYVGIAKNGKMATPNNFSDVGWFEYGTVPGNTGSAIIAGHVDNGLAFPAVFADLGNVIIGDDVYIDTNGGNTIHFKVTNIQAYDANAQTEEIFNQNDGNYLKLITCTGAWSILHRTHNQRLVVTATEI
jgi:LPXTG-site transpeptidase (sortase) family protein